MNASEDLQTQLRKASAECASLREENQRLRKLLGLSEKTSSLLNTRISEPSVLYSSTIPPVTNASPSETQIGIFRSLFRGREDVYAVRWESKKGISGYSPACVNEWTRPLCGKPRIKCADCENRVLKPITDEVIRDHLLGKHTIGIYPLLEGETCCFLAVDFDGKTWQEDAAAFIETCEGWSIPATLERSRSGNGGHTWIFFDHPVQASLARKFGCAILTCAMERRHQIGLDSYDRFFPGQDTMPKGGFGNLIALPLQRGPREKGNSVFLNRELEVYPDQLGALFSMKRVLAEEVESLVREATRNDAIIGIRVSMTDEYGEEDPWTMPPSRKKPEKPIEGPLPESVRIVQGNLVYVEKKGLPLAMLNRLIRLAAFQNPEFYKAQAMRLSTFGKSRVIGCAEDFPNYIGLPRGCLDETVEQLKSYGIKSEIIDERFEGVPIDVVFGGDLRPLQKEAGLKLLASEFGVLSAPTAFGKTVIGAWLIAQRRVNTLVLVHRQQLMDQWRERLALFLGLPIERLGQIGGGKKKVTGFVDIGLLQSLNRKGQVKNMVAGYGQIIVDECHHIPAFSFEQVLKQAKAKYIVGLTATPIRKDGHHPIIIMQCGPIRFSESAKKQAAARPFKHVVITRHTDFKASLESKDLGIQDIYAALALDTHRNELISDDLLKALSMGRSPLLLTERVEHLDFFAGQLKNFAKNIFVLKGGMGSKQRREVFDQIKAIPGPDERVILATGRYIGEGFDDARLDTLFLGAVNK